MRATVLCHPILMLPHSDCILIPNLNTCMHKSLFTDLRCHGGYTYRQCLHMPQSLARQPLHLLHLILRLYRCSPPAPVNFFIGFVGDFLTTVKLSPDCCIISSIGRLSSESTSAETCRFLSYINKKNIILSLIICT